MKLGDIFAGRYRLLKHLGTGGMGVVVLAEDIEKGNVLVALKFVRSELSNDTRAINDLRREVVNAQKLTDRHIVRVHDLMKYGDRYFISMEYVEGEDLNTRLGRYQEHGRNFSVEEVLEVARDVCPAIDYAHEQRVLHLDIKPGNIIAMKGGGYKIMDFGIARSAHESMTRISRAPGYTGGYAPPEQILGKQIGRRADVYALSATFYDLLAGKPPCPSEYATINVEPEPIEGVPDNVNRALLKGLAKNPDDRFRTAGELLRALEGERVEPPPPSDEVEVPNLVGLDIDMARDIISRKLLRVKINTIGTKDITLDNKVIKQYPSSGIKVNKGSGLLITVGRYERVEEEKEIKYEEVPKKSKWWLYLISFISPLIGLIVGIVYLNMKEYYNKKVGKKCIIWSLVGISLCLIWWLISILIMQFSSHRIQPVTDYYSNPNYSMSYNNSIENEEDIYIPPQKVQSEPSGLGEKIGKIQVISESGLNVRDGPGISCKIIDKIFSSDVYYYYAKESYVNENNKIESWYEVIGEDGNVGWVCSYYNGENLLREIE